VFGFGVGLEYSITPRVPVRIGYDLTQSATPKERPLPFATPPGLLHAGHIGAGLRLDHLDLDIAGIYAKGSSDISSSEVAKGAQFGAGKYSLTTRAVAFSATYHL
jgi:hypothetical protein